MADLNEKCSEEFKNDFKRANELGSWVIPILNQYLEFGRIIQTEHLNESLARLLDKKSGIDGVYIDKDGDVSGVAIRIQECECKDWGTFTQRYSRTTGTITEYWKRRKQLYEKSEQCFYPHYTVHVYANKRENVIYGGGICFTRDLYDVIRRYEPLERHFRAKNQLVYLDMNESDGNKFVVIKRSALLKYQKLILEIPYSDKNMRVKECDFSKMTQAKEIYSTAGM